MKIVLSDKERLIICQTAVIFGEDERKLEKTYLETMQSNFRQDVWDIAKENEEELRVEEQIKCSKKKGEK